MMITMLTFHSSAIIHCVNYSNYTSYSHSAKETWPERLVNYGDVSLFCGIHLPNYAILFDMNS